MNGIRLAKSTFASVLVREVAHNSMESTEFIAASPSALFQKPQKATKVN
jgi:hypothetical protein